MSSNMVLWFKGTVGSQSREGGRGTVWDSRIEALHVCVIMLQHAPVAQPSQQSTGCCGVLALPPCRQTSHDATPMHTYRPVQMYVMMCCCMQTAVAQLWRWLHAKTVH